MASYKRKRGTRRKTPLPKRPTIEEVRADEMARCFNCAFYKQNPTTRSTGWCQGNSGAYKEIKGHTPRPGAACGSFPSFEVNELDCCTHIHKIMDNQS